jgi:hypothetical protein
MVSAFIALIVFLTWLGIFLDLRAALLIVLIVAMILTSL